jgi:hypothetical protein
MDTKILVRPVILSSNILIRNVVVFDAWCMNTRFYLFYSDVCMFENYIMLDIFGLPRTL